MKLRDTAIGFVAIIMWAFLALLSTAVGPVPPFLLTAMAFLIGALSIMVTWPFRPQAIRSLRQPIGVWVIGCLGLCAYHCLYFYAIQNAPPVEASLIAYLWPLLIVLFSALLPGERLKFHHVLGAICGLAGAALIITKGGQVGFSSGIKSGHVAALACAFVWSSYSLLSRRYPGAPPDVVAGFCLVTSVVAVAIHFAVQEPMIMPVVPSSWVALVLLGVFPLGLAFFTWDIGVKKGDIQVLGAASYASPLLSTLVMLAAGLAAYSNSLVIACLLITLGATLAAKDMIFRRKS